MPCSLITGAAGFIGSHLVDRLLEKGHKVIGIDDLSLGRESNLAAARARGGFRLIVEDVNDELACETASRLALTALAADGVDEIWHLAANSDIQAGSGDPGIDLSRTFMTTFHSLGLARRLGIREMVLASTSAIYGEKTGMLAEDTGPLFPVSNYGAMKLASEGVVSAALQTGLEKAWIFRFPNVVGGRATHGVIFDLIRKLRRDPSALEVLGDGAQEKPYLHVDELIDAMLFCRERGRERLNCFNVGSQGTTMTVRAIAERVVAEVAPGAQIRYTGGSRGWIGDVPRFQYSTKKLNALGWRPKMNSDQAVARTVRELKEEIPA